MTTVGQGEGVAEMNRRHPEFMPPHGGLTTGAQLYCRDAVRLPARLGALHSEI
jgi:hypothetical protein